MKKTTAILTILLLCNLFACAIFVYDDDDDNKPHSDNDSLTVIITNNPLYPAK
jgi:hypothetical protein